MKFTCGLDLGQSADYTALAILEQQEGTEDRPCFDVRHLERFPLGTPYPAVVADVGGKLRTLGKANAELVVDKTGVGAPVCDLFAQAGLRPICITITGGDSVIRVPDGYRTPKRELASVLQVLLQGKRLRIARDLPEAATLVRELLAFRVKISVSGHDTYESWREGTHDDLVLAVALAAWFALNGPQPLVSAPELHRKFWNRGAESTAASWRG